MRRRDFVVLLGCSPACPLTALRAFTQQPARRGVFAVGDVRAKSVKRVAAAVGEGAQVVAALRSFLTAPRPG